MAVQGDAPRPLNTMESKGEGASERSDVILGTTNILANRFEGFHDALESEKSRKKQELEAKFEAVHHRADTLDHSLKLESKNTKNSLKAMKEWLEDRFVEFEKSVVTPINAEFKKVNKRIDDLKEYIERVEVQQNKDRVTAAKAVKECAADFTNKLDSFKRKFDETIAGITENRKEVQLQLREQERRLVNQLKDEREAREKNEARLGEEIDKEEKVRAKGQKILGKDIIAKTEALQVQIRAEVEERKKGDEKLVKAVAHYTGALQDAVKIVSQQE